MHILYRYRVHNGDCGDIQSLEVRQQLEGRVSHSVKRIVLEVSVKMKISKICLDSENKDPQIFYHKRYKLLQVIKYEVEGTNMV